MKARYYLAMAIFCFGAILLSLVAMIVLGHWLPLYISGVFLIAHLILMFLFFRQSKKETTERKPRVLIWDEAGVYLNSRKYELSKIRKRKEDEP